MGWIPGSARELASSLKIWRNMLLGLLRRGSPGLYVASEADRSQDLAGMPSFPEFDRDAVFRSEVLRPH